MNLSPASCGVSLWKNKIHSAEANPPAWPKPLRRGEGPPSSRRSATTARFVPRLHPRSKLWGIRRRRRKRALIWTGTFWLGWISTSFCIDISPSKYQGGSTNDIPNKTIEGAPSLFPNPFKWIFGSPYSTAMERVHAPPNFKVNLSTEPKDFTATSNAVLKVRMTVLNGGDKYILEFNTAQHYDFAINNNEGKEQYRYSNDKVFSQELSSVVLNRNEKLVYEETISSPSNQVLNLPPGKYKLIGQVTATVPISVETSFQVVP